MLFGVSKISFKIFFQAFFCWLLTCVYHIYWIRTHWYWNLSLVVIENFQCAVYKPDIRIWFLSRLVEVCGEGAVFFISPVAINTLTGSKAVPQVIQVWSCVCKCCPKVNQGGPRNSKGGQVEPRGTKGNQGLLGQFLVYFYVSH